MIKILFAVALGGALGAVCRYLVMVLTLNAFGSFLPWGTLMVNVLGSFLMGYLSLFLFHRVGASSFLNMFMIVGVLGAFTTFSTFSIETYHLFMNQHWVYATLNMISSVVLCLLFVTLGVYLATPK